MDGVLVNDTKREALVLTLFRPYIYLQGGSLGCDLRHRQMNSHCAEARCPSETWERLIGTRGRRSRSDDLQLVLHLQEKSFNICIYM